MNWYVLRVDRTREDEEKSSEYKKSAKKKTTSEERVLSLLKKRLNSEIYTPFIPMKVYPHTKGGKLQSKELRMCFPGYVFIATEMEDEFVVTDTKLILEGDKGSALLPLL